MLQNECSENEEYDYYKYSAKKNQLGKEIIEIDEISNEREDEHASDDSNNENYYKNDYPDEDELNSDKEINGSEDVYYSNEDES